MSYTTRWRELMGRARPGSPIGPVAHLILHHEAGWPLPASATLAQEHQRLKAVDAYHLSKGWQGFGYSTMPCASGRNHEGRGYDRSGGHTGHMNRTSLAALLPGTDTGMTPAQVHAIRAWQAAGVDQGHITDDAIWTGHRDHMNRDCPGDRNYSQLNRLNENASEDPMATLDTDDIDAIARAVTRQVWEHPVGRTGETHTYQLSKARGDAAAARALVEGFASDAGIDQDQLAAAVAARVDIDIDELAARIGHRATAVEVADELARRLTEASDREESA